MLAGLQLFPNQQQFLIVIFSHPGRVDTYPDMTETFILVKHGLDFPGIDKSGKVVVHIKGNTPYLRVAFQERSQRHMGSTAQRQAITIPFPSLQLLKGGNWKDVCWPVTAEFRKQLNDALIDGYGQAIENLQATLEATKGAAEKPSLTGALKENAGKVKEQPAKPATSKNEQAR